MAHGHKFNSNNEIFIPGKFQNINRKVIVEEAIRSSHKHISVFRRITYQETCGDYRTKNSHIEVIESNRNFGNTGHISNLNIRDKFSNFIKCRSNSQLTMADTNEEPMDVDMSGGEFIPHDSIEDVENPSGVSHRRLHHPNFNSDLHYTEPETSTTLNPVGHAISKSLVFLITLTTIFTMLGIYVIITGDRYILMNSDVLAQDVKTDLKKHVMFQDNSIDSIVYSFENMNSWTDPIRILAFVGSSGVGKTYTANLIKRNFLSSLVHEINDERLSKTEEQDLIIGNIKSCCLNLIIIEDLRGHDLYHLMQFINKLPRYQHLMVIPIFNILDETLNTEYKINTDDFKLIRDELDQSKIFYEIVIFDVIELNMAKNWIREQLEKRGIPGSKREAIVKWVLQDHPVKFRGLKGLNSKIVLALKTG